MIIFGYLLFLLGMSSFFAIQSIEVYVVASLILVIASIFMAVAAKKIVDANKEKVSIIKQLFAVFIITLVLRIIVTEIIRDASPFPSMIFGCWVALCSNLLFIAVFKIAKHYSMFNPKIIVLILIIILLGTPFVYNFPHNLKWSNLNKFQKGQEVQFFYRYKDDIYYVSSRHDGINKMSLSGEITKVVDSSKVKNESDLTLKVDKNMAYFLNNEHWQKINLDTGEINDEPGFQADFYSVDYTHNKYNFWAKSKLQEKVGLIVRELINDDGYIYFSSNTGLYRTKLDSEVPELLIEGNITMFDIADGVITYYDINKVLQINKAPLPMQLSKVK